MFRIHTFLGWGEGLPESEWMGVACSGSGFLGMLMLAALALHTLAVLLITVVSM